MCGHWTVKQQAYSYSPRNYNQSFDKFATKAESAVRAHKRNGLVGNVVPIVRQTCT